jgi:hypothetical protein
VVNHAIDGRGRRHWVLEDLVPLREHQIARDDDRLSLVLVQAPQFTFEEQVARALVSDTSLTTVELTDGEAAALWRDSRVVKERLDSHEIDELLAGLEVA